MVAYGYAIEMEGVWKKFKVYHDKSLSLKEKVLFWNREKTYCFWALKDISVKFPFGSTIGLIGRNGSGKSTLLKLVSKILYPNGGKIVVNGRISTLLELGAGFHPDYTGRENIFLNASILGLSRKEIKAKLDEIIRFADLGDFIDNPIRNYSSGMYTRLGFAVAVHVDPDILLVDEVLSVGDLPFQQKCLSKINEIKDKGTTIVIVSHNLETLSKICDHIIWLHEGSIVSQGPAKDVIKEYVSGFDGH